MKLDILLPILAGLGLAAAQRPTSYPPNYFDQPVSSEIIFRTLQDLIVLGRLITSLIARDMPLIRRILSSKGTFSTRLITSLAGPCFST